MKKITFVLAFIAVALGASAQQPKPLVLTDETKFVDLPNDCNWISDLDDGVWTVKSGNAFGFFLDDGSKLFDFEWQSNSTYRDPKMLGGAVIMYKKGEIYDKPQYILYRDGSIKELPIEYSGAATNFVDGVALIGKKKSFYGVDYVYINVKGERVYGDLVSSPDRFNGENYTLPPLKEGLRAFKSPSEYKWGYIDANGKIVIPARFKKCRSFNEGYALVEENNKIFFIDKKGNKVFEPSWGSDVYFNDVSDVRDGYFVVNNSPRTYYNMKGEKVFEGKHGTWFYGGYSIYDDPNDQYKYSLVIDKDFKTIRRIPNVESGWDDFGCTPTFTEAGVASVKHEKIIAPDGTTLIQHYPITNERANGSSIGSFSRSGYAQAWLNHNGVRYKGFINLDGEFVIVYDWDRKVTEITIDPNNPISERKPIVDPRRPKKPIEPEDKTPKGPRTTTRQDYTVTVIANPANGGSVKGGGKYHLGDKVSLSATPKDGWKLKEWECNTMGFYAPDLPNGVTIDGRDLSFTANFYETPKKDTIINVETSGGFSGHNKARLDKKSDFTLDFDVYMELSSAKDIKSPYGNNTYGFLTCVIDGTKDIVVPQKVNGKETTLSFKAFYVPMKVSGIIKDNKDGKRYLVLDGGQVMVNDIHLGEADLFAALFVNTMLGVEGTLGTASNARYRLELKDYNESTGECTFGELYRFHPELGWVLTDDYPVKYANTFFGTKSEDNSISGDFLRGVHMKPSAKRTVEFVPPKGWIKEGYDSAVKAFLNEMGNLVTDWDEFFKDK